MLPGLPQRLHETPMDLAAKELAGVKADVRMKAPKMYKTFFIISPLPKRDASR